MPRLGFRMPCPPRYAALGLSVLSAAGCDAPRSRDARTTAPAPIRPAVGDQDPPPEAQGTSTEGEGPTRPRVGRRLIDLVTEVPTVPSMDPNQGASSLTLNTELASPEEIEAQKGEWFAAPIPFLDAQVGWGLVIAGGYIFAPNPGVPRGRKSMAVAGGAIAEFLEAGFGGVQHYTPNWKLQLFGAGGDLTYDFFGIGNDEGDQDQSIRLDSVFTGVHGKALYYLGDDFYVGPTATFAAVDTTVVGSPVPPELQDNLDDENVLVGARGEHDSRDNEFFPTDGNRASATVDVASEALGGSNDYQVYSLEYARYHGIGAEGDEQPVLAWHVKSRFADGSAPFYVLPSHDLRGYVRGRYRDRFWLAGEVEWRQPICHWFGVAAFAGLGQVANKPGAVNLDDLLGSGGAGIRIRLTKKNPLFFRVDVGVGRNEGLLYISVGEAF